MAYTATYATADIGAMVVDFIGGVMVGLAGAATPLIWAIIAGIIIGLVGYIIVAVKGLGGGY